MAKTMTGIVISDKGNKTAVVAVHGHKTHPIYKKRYPSSKNYTVHDENNDANVGDTVLIVETRPLSATKRHAIDKIIERAKISADKTIEAITADEPQTKKKQEQDSKENSK